LVVAIVAFAFGSLYVWVWLDPVMGIVSALVIARWSWGFVHNPEMVLLD
jgi:Co/Zn/Cd efflux system component